MERTDPSYSGLAAVTTGQPTIRPDGLSKQVLPPQQLTLGSIVELLKPITWFAPMWAYGCGVVSGGPEGWTHGGAALAGAVLAGPLVCGASQAVNDWFDRDVDAINEPNRPIPSGRIPGLWGLVIAAVAGGLGVILAAYLGPWVLAATACGLAGGWAYSAPPLRLKRNGWLSTSVCAACYEGLPWFTGAAATTGALPSVPVLVLCVLFSAGAQGIMTLNDFKAVDGDRALGLRSLPVLIGVQNSAKLACAVMGLSQVAVAGFLLHWGRPTHAAIEGGLVLIQLGLMPRLLADPVGRAPWYNATGTTLFVLGMLCAALAVRSLG